jgi:L-serine deaminase
MRQLIVVLALLYQSPCFAADDGGDALKTSILIAIIGGLMGLIPLVVKIISNRSQRKTQGQKDHHQLAAPLGHCQKINHNISGLQYNPPCHQVGDAYANDVAAH